MSRVSVLLCAGLIIWQGLQGTAAVAADWPQWRGPQFNGSTTDRNLPTDFGPDRNLAWKASMPGPSAATPVVCGEQVFVSSVDAAAESLLAIALDRSSGREVWRKEISQGIRKDSRSTFSAPSPATDGEIVVFFYSNGEMVAFDYDGRRLWGRNIQEDYGEFAFLWTFSSTPLLFDGKLYLQVLQRDVSVEGRGFADRENKSYLLALDPKTGKELWRVFRPSKARQESKEAFSSPIPITHEGRTELVIAGGDCVTGHDPDTGREQWRWGTYNPDRITHWRFVPSPVYGAGVILVCAPKGDPIYAVKAGGDGVLTDDCLAWVSREERAVTSDVPTPAFYDGDFFILSDVKKSLCRVAPQTGEVKWQIRTPGLLKYEASPLAGDGNIYLLNFGGDVVIVDAVDGKIVREVAMGEGERDRQDSPVRSSIIAADRKLFIRTNAFLYCVGKSN